MRNLKPSPDLAEAIDLEQVKPRYGGMGDEKLYHVLRSIALKRPTFSPEPGDQLLLQMANTPITDSPTEVDRQIEVWHETEDPRPLHEFLGWTLEEYEYWGETQIEPERQSSTDEPQDLGIVD